MRIGELAKRSAIKTDTVRYYEKVGLLEPPPRRPNGYRHYGAEHIERLAFIRHCRVLGMSLEDIRRLLGLAEHPEADCGAVDRMIEEHLIRVRTRLADLRQLEQQLEALRRQCTMQTSVDRCGILQELVAAAQDGGCVCHPTETEDEDNDAADRR
jgi:Cd(II)/Pb(II)-responsive transcriptional regulator